MGGPPRAVADGGGGTIIATAEIAARPERVFQALLAVIPDASHFVLFSEQEKVIPVVKHFLEGPEEKPPIATLGTGYHPGETR